MKRVFLALAMTLCAATTAVAQSVSGNWEGLLNTPGGARPIRFELVQAGEKLTGTVKRESGDVPLEGTVSANNVKFAYTINYGGSPVTIAITAAVTGEEMKGQVDIASQMQDVFSAKRVAGSPPKP
jgi:hypothetical protein